MRPIFQWNLGSRSLELGRRTLIMGVLNVTPDSFSDGGHFLEAGKAVDHATRLLDEGADVIDIGGRSKPPGTHLAAAGRAISGLGAPAAEPTAPPGPRPRGPKPVISAVASVKEQHP